MRLGRSRTLVVALCLLAALAVGLAYAQMRATQARQDTWDRMQARGVVRIGMDASYPPFAWVDEAGAFYGLDVDLGRRLAQRWGVEVEFVNVHFAGLYDVLYTGRVDMLLSALPYDRMLTRDVLYSSSYFAAGQVMLVPETAQSFASVADLSGATVAVELGATAHQLARTLDRDRALGLEVQPFRELHEAAEAVVAGDAAALLSDRVSALGLVSTQPLRIAGEPLTDEPFVIAVRPDSPRLLREIDAALGEWEADGTLDAIGERWLLPR